MDGLLPFFGAGIAVMALVLLSGWLGFRGLPRLEGANEAVAIAQALPGGFPAVSIALGSNGCAAILADSSGRVAIVGVHGAHFIAREIDRASVARCTDGEIAIRSGNLEARIELGRDAGGWMERLRRAGASA